MLPALQISSTGGPDQDDNVQIFPAVFPLALHSFGGTRSPSSLSLCQLLIAVLASVLRSKWTPGLVGLLAARSRGWGHGGTS